jgi:hypothetical protein
MWLSILIVIGIVGGLAAALAGIGPIAIVLVVLGVIALATKVFGGAAGGRREVRETPQDTENAPATHIETGYAHRGQEHMTG